jgi:hypothetical protein
MINISEKKESKSKWIETASVIMLGVIMIAISYSSYEAHLWSGIQTFLLRDVNKDSLQTAKEELSQGQHTSIDVLTFTQYSNALIRNDQNLSNFYYQRFTPEMKLAVDAWLQTDPLKNPNAPSSPFVMSEYNRTHVLLAQQFEEKTNLELQQAQQANENSSNYVFLSVLYSSALFIDGVIGRTSNKKLGHILLYITMTITVIATIILIQIPSATKLFGT